MKKVYLDYSATTMVDNIVLKKFTKLVKKNYANSNSNHDLGKQSKKVIEESINNICSYFNVEKEEIIFTSGSSESNNTVIKGLSEIDNRKKIITTYLEHSSILSPLSYLQNKGYIVEFVKLDKNGNVNINDLKNKLDTNTLLVSINLVDSELGIRQDINKLSEIVKGYDNTIYFHSDITQGLGKKDINLDNIDFASFSGHKIYTFKGIGGLVKKKNVKLNSLIHGGKSTTIYRSGTPQMELIYSLGNSFNIFKNDLNIKYQYVSDLNKKIKNYIKKHSNIIVNSPKDSIPHILNLSFIGKKSNDIQKYFNDHNVYISTKAACSSDNKISKIVMNLYKDEKRAISSVRISLSYKTTTEEIDYLLTIIDKYMEENYENN